MRIYMAGFHAAHGVNTAHGKVSSSADPPWVLESYHYLNRDKVNLIRALGRTVFLDSGAFSMFTQGVEVDLEAYAQFIRDNGDIIHLASNLDAIGAGNEQLSYDRQKRLEGLGVNVCPVHHARDRDEWLERYLEEGYEYIFLGGMVPESTGFLREWLDRIWHEYLTNPDGTPRVKIHGFGLTTLTLMFRYPWFSVDSTSWVMTSRFGAIYLDFPQPDGSVVDRKIDFSSQSSKRRKDGSWHFETLTPEEQRAVRRRLEELEAARAKDPELELRLKEEMGGIEQGFNPEALAYSYGWRDRANIEYFRRAMDRRINTFKRQQETLF